MKTHSVLQIEFGIHGGDALAVSRLVHLHHTEVAPVHKGDILTLVEALGVSGLDKDHWGQDNRFFTDLSVLGVKWSLKGGKHVDHTLVEQHYSPSSLNILYPRCCGCCLGIAPRANMLKMSTWLLHPEW